MNDVRDDVYVCVHACICVCKICKKNFNKKKIPQEIFCIDNVQHNHAFIKPDVFFSIPSFWLATL